MLQRAMRKLPDGESGVVEGEVVDDVVVQDLDGAAVVVLVVVVAAVLVV